MNLEVVAPEVPAQLMALVIQPNLLERIKNLQPSDSSLQKVRRGIEEGKGGDFHVHADGTLRFQNRWCVPENEELRELILREAEEKVRLARKRLLTAQSRQQICMRVG